MKVTLEEGLGNYLCRGMLVLLLSGSKIVFSKKSFIAFEVSVSLLLEIRPQGPFYPLLNLLWALHPSFIVTKSVILEKNSKLSLEYDFLPSFKNFHII
jgi:hypothetical protein